jgi:hypothetical protein
VTCFAVPERKDRRLDADALEIRVERFAGRPIRAMPWRLPAACANLKRPSDQDAPDFDSGCCPPIYMILENTRTVPSRHLAGWFVTTPTTRTGDW